MAKRVKFNLIIDDVAIRNLDGVRENFNIDDILDYYKSGVLQKWLKVRSFNEELERVEAIKSENSFDIVKELVDIFGVDGDSNDLKSAIYHIDYIRAKRESLEKFSQDAKDRSLLIENYHNGYENEKLKIIENSRNCPLLKEAIINIEQNYSELFRLDYRAFFVNFFTSSPLTILSILINRGLRDLILKDSDVHSEIKEIIDIRDQEVKKIYQQSKSIKGLEPYYESITKTYRGDTEQNWRTIENGEVLILQSNSGTKVREVDSSGEDSELTHIYSKGQILRGLEFYSYKDSHFIKYIKLSDIDGYIGEIRCFRGVTNGYWKDIESSEKEYLILQMSSGSYIRNLGFHGEELSSADINGKFPILKGIDYKSNSVNHTLYYIEI